MTTRRSRRWIIASGIALASLTAALIVGEVVARTRLEGRLAAIGDELTGVGVAFAGGPALPQVIGGRIGIELTFSDSALSAYARCRSRQDLTVRATESGLIVTTERSIRGLTLPVDVVLVPRQDGDRWSLVADSVSAAGFSLPAERAVKVLAGKDSADSRIATRLLDGIALPSDDRLAVTSVNVADGAAILTATAPTDRSDGGQAAELSRLRTCLGDGED